MFIKRLHLTRKKLRSLSFIAILAIIVLVPLALYLARTPRQAAAWFDDAFLYRQKSTITNSGSAQTDYQVMITMDTDDLITAGKLQSDCDDIRITNQAGQILNHYIEEDTCNGNTTLLWIKLASIPTSSTTYYIYYGNPSAPNIEQPELIFDFFDNFSGTSLHSSKWTQRNGGSPSFSNGEMTVSANTTDPSKLVATGAPQGNNYVLKSKVKATAGTNGGERAGVSIKSTDSASPQGYNYVLTDFTAIDEVSFLDDGAAWNVRTQAWTKNTYYTLEIYHDGTNVAGRFNGGSWLTQAWSGRTGYPALNIGSFDATTVWDYAFVYKITSTPPTASAPASEEKGTGPVTYWKFDEGTNDSTCNGGTNDICDSTGSNAGDFGASTATPSWRTEDMCISGKCLYFDGTDDYIDVGKGTSVKGKAGYTISTWVKPMGTADTSCTTIYWESTTTTNSSRLGLMQCDVSGEQVFEFRFRPGTSTLHTVRSTVNPVVGTWYHLSAVYDSTNDVYSLYINGVLDAKSSGLSLGSVDNTDPNDTIRIGELGASLTRFFKGFMDEMKVYQYARTQAQINTDYQRVSATAGSSVVLGTSSNEFLSDGLVGYWKMNESAANSCTGGANDSCDSSGNGFDLAWANQTAVANGKFGTGTTFDGTDDNASCTDANCGGAGKLDFDATQSFSYAAWFKTNQSAHGSVIMGKKLRNADTIPGWNLNVDPGGYAQCFLDTGTTAAITSFGTYNDDAWHQAVCVWDGQSKQLNIYVDGNLTSGSMYGNPSALSGSFGNSESFMIGMAPYAAQDTDLDGEVDEARVYNRALNATEVSSLYNWAPGPVAHWKMDEGSWTQNCSTDTVFDSSGNGYNGDSCPSTTGPSTTIGKYGNAGLFDSSDDQVTVPSTFQIPSLQGSVSAWVNPTVAGKDILASGVNLNDFRLSPQNNLYGFFISSEYRVSYATDPTLNTWTYVTLTWDQTNGSVLYYNGVRVASNSTPPPAYSQTGLNIGTRPGGGGDYWGGKIDDVKVYNYPRTPGQIVEDMNASHPAGGSPISSILGYWKLDEDTGDTAYDSGYGGNNLNLAHTDATCPTTSDSGCPTRTTGKVNKALNFDISGTTDDYVKIDDTDELDFNDTDDFTFSAWININSYSTARVIMDKKNGVLASSTGYQLQVNSSGKVQLYVADGTDQVIVSSNTTLSTGTWYHVAAVWDQDSSTNTRVYINGKRESGTLSGTMGTIGTLANTNGFAIGAQAQENFNFDGKIDEAKLYNSALTADQILIDMNAGSAISLGGVLGTQDNEGFGGNAPTSWWKFDDNTSTSAVDSSGNGKTGTLTGTGTMWKPGKYGSAVSLSGSAGDYINVGDDALYDFGSGDFTLQAWIKRESSTTADMIIAKDNNTSGTRQFNLMIASTDFIRVRYFTATDTEVYLDTSDLILDTDWHHVVGMRSGNSFNIYIDGKLSASGTTTGSHGTMQSTTSQLQIGRREYTGSTDEFHGQIDDVKIYNYARTPGQVAYDFNRGAPVAHYKFDECQGTSANNAAPAASGGDAGLDGTITPGDATGSNDTAGTCNSGTNTEMWHNGTTGKFGASLDFDGTNDHVAIASDSKLQITGDMSVSAWINPATIGNGEAVLSYRGGDDTEANNVLYALTWNTASGNDIRYQHEYSAGTNVNLDFDTNLSTSNWYHVLFTRTVATNEVNLYINGKHIEQEIYSNDPTGGTTSNLTIGAEDSTAGFFDGLIDDVRIYNYSLTADMVKKLSKGGGTVSF